MSYYVDPVSSYPALHPCDRLGAMVRPLVNPPRRPPLPTTRPPRCLSSATCVVLAGTRCSSMCLCPVEQPACTSTSSSFHQRVRQQSVEPDTSVHGCEIALTNSSVLHNPPAAAMYFSPVGLQLIPLESDHLHQIRLSSAEPRFVLCKNTESHTPVAGNIGIPVR